MYNRPIIQNALTQAQVRIVTNKTTFLNMMINIGNFLSYEVIFANIMIMISYAIIMLVKNRNKELNIKNNIVQSIPYLIVAMMPLAWYAVLKQHSMIHRFFTYRALVITIITLMVSEYKILEVKTQDKKRGNQMKKENIVLYVTILLVGIIISGFFCHFIQCQIHTMFCSKNRNIAQLL